jgi:hypothetical protein
MPNHVGLPARRSHANHSGCTPPMVYSCLKLLGKLGCVPNSPIPCYVDPCRKQQFSLDRAITALNEPDPNLTPFPFLLAPALSIP